MYMEKIRVWTFSIFSKRATEMWNRSLFVQENLRSILGMRWYEWEWCDLSKRSPWRDPEAEQGNGDVCTCPSLTTMADKCLLNPVVWTEIRSGEWQKHQSNQISSECHSPMNTTKSISRAGGSSAERPRFHPQSTTWLTNSRKERRFESPEGSLRLKRVEPTEGVWTCSTALSFMSQRLLVLVRVFLRELFPLSCDVWFPPTAKNYKSWSSLHRFCRRYKRNVLIFPSSVPDVTVWDGNFCF